jgi:hypothetical protein
VLLFFEERFIEISDERQFTTLSNKFQDLSSYIETIFSYYIERYDDATNFAQHLLSTNAKFARFCKVNDKIIGHSLDSLQIEPVQRLTRYVLLLRECHKALPEDHSERTSLIEAIQKLQQVCERISTNVSNRSAQRMVYVLQENLFKNKISLLTEWRKCIRFGSLMKKGRSPRVFGSKDRSLMFILFSDCIVCASLFSDGHSAKLIQAFPLGGMRIRNIPDQPRSSKYSFEIINSNKNLTVCAESQQSKTEWISAIQSAVTALEDHYKASEELFPFGADIFNSLKSLSAPTDELRRMTEEFFVLPDETPWISDS